MKIEMVSRGFETFLDGSSVVELESGCGMWGVVSGLGLGVRETLHILPRGQARAP